jgi:lipopolysaccharide/colanic/teichoic acid biosynthesis glycosyltransferase
MNGRYDPVKRLIDLVVSVPALVAIMPVQAAVAAAVGVRDTPAGFTVNGVIAR